MAGFEIKCLKCGRRLEFEGSVRWMPMVDEEDVVYGMRVQLECPCGNAVGYADLFSDSDDSPDEEDCACDCCRQ
jgi:hypothetical protein